MLAKVAVEVCFASENRRCAVFVTSREGLQILVSSIKVIPEIPTFQEIKRKLGEKVPS